jgi:hypothetical protein
MQPVISLAAGCLLLGLLATFALHVDASCSQSAFSFAVDTNAGTVSLSCRGYALCFD